MYAPAPPPASPPQHSHQVLSSSARLSCPLSQKFLLVCPPPLPRPKLTAPLSPPSPCRPGDWRAAQPASRRPRRTSAARINKRATTQTQEMLFIYLQLSIYILSSCTHTRALPLLCNMHDLHSHASTLPPCGLVIFLQPKQGRGIARPRS